MIGSGYLVRRNRGGRYRLVCRWWIVPAIALSGACNNAPPNFTPSPATVLPAEGARVAFQSQCAQNVITCTTSFPVAVAEVVAGEGQTVTKTETGYLVQGNDGDGVEIVNLVGSRSTMGVGASEIVHAWSYGATDGDPLTLRPGTVFSVAADFSVQMAVGLHYVRLSVVNDLIEEELVSDEFGVIGTNVPKSDFVELEIEVRD